MIERILKIIRKNKRDNKNYANTECTTCADHIINIHMKYNIHGQMNIKERVTKLIKENEKYFIYEIMRTISDAIFYRNYCDMDRIKNLGYSHRINGGKYE